MLLYSLGRIGGEVLEVLRRRAANGDSLRLVADAVKAVNIAHAAQEDERQAALDEAAAGQPQRNCENQARRPGR